MPGRPEFPRGTPCLKERAITQIKADGKPVDKGERNLSCLGPLELRRRRLGRAAFRQADLPPLQPEHGLPWPSKGQGSDHHYTGSEEERDGLVAKGWTYEGIAGAWRKTCATQELGHSSPQGTRRRPQSASRLCRLKIRTARERALRWPERSKLRTTTPAVPRSATISSSLAGSTKALQSCDFVTARLGAKTAELGRSSPQTTQVVRHVKKKTNGSMNR